MEAVRIEKRRKQYYDGINWYCQNIPKLSWEKVIKFEVDSYLSSCASSNFLRFL